MERGLIKKTLSVEEIDDNLENTTKEKKLKVKNKFQYLNLDFKLTIKF